MNFTQTATGAGTRSLLAKRIGALFGAAALVVALSACSGSGIDQYAGIYTGDSGRTTVELNDDGSAVVTQEGLKQRPTEEDTTTWRLEEGKLILVENSVWDYDVYATTDDASEPLFFQSEDSSWDNELFTRVSS